MSKGIFFTISPTERGGVTDQLFQFSSFYALGASLGYTYHHRQFVSRRSSAPAVNDGNAQRSEHAQSAYGLAGRYTDVYDFLGFNAFLGSRNPQPLREHLRKIDVRLGDRELRPLGVVSISSLQQYLIQQVAAAKGDLPILLNLSLSGGGRGFLALIQNQLRDYTLSNELLTAYHDARANDPVASVFAPQSLRILAHVRLGDTAVFRTPWNTFVPLWPPDGVAELRTPPTKGRIQLSDFWRFLATLSAKLGEQSHSFALFSDGYHRSFNTLRSHRSDLGLAEWQIDLLTAAEDSYDQLEFSIFKGLPNCALFIGEEPVKLYQLLHSCLTADVVVISSHQRLIPKLLQVYLPPEAMPIVVVLVGAKRKIDTDPIPSHSSLGLRSCARNFFYLHPDDSLGLHRLAEKISVISTSG